MSEEELIALRKEKLQQLRAAGIDPYPARFNRTHSAQEAVEKLGEATQNADSVIVAGRITALRQKYRNRSALLRRFNTAGL